MTLTCGVSDAGQPAVTQYRWTRNGHVIPEISGAQWNVSQVTLSYQANYSCTPVNEAGEGETAVTEVEVYGEFLFFVNGVGRITKLIRRRTNEIFKIGDIISFFSLFLSSAISFYCVVAAAPTFIERLPPTSGALADAADATKLSCRVECYPLCQIDWFRNGEPIRESPMYTVVDSFVPENVKVRISIEKCAMANPYIYVNKFCVMCFVAVASRRPRACSKHTERSNIPLKDV